MATQRKSAGISIPFWDVARRAAIGAHSCQEPKRLTFISLSFFERCFNANRGNKNEKTGFPESLGWIVGAFDCRWFAAFHSQGRSQRYSLGHVALDPTASS